MLIGSSPLTNYDVHGDFITLLIYILLLKVFLYQCYSNKYHVLVGYNGRILDGSSTELRNKSGLLSLYLRFHPLLI